jgi:hypothetical protein
VRSLAVALLVTASCSGHHDDTARRKPDSPITFVPSDASPNAVAPASDSSANNQGDLAALPVQPPPGGPRERRPIDVTLRSTPPGAVVAVDGTALGVTPAFWGGYADGHEHEFVFTMPKYAIARYRFVPVTSGVIHARLDPIAEEHDAGVAPPPEVVPVQPPPVPASPPPPLLTPDAATVGSGSAATGSASPGSAASGSAASGSAAPRPPGRTAGSAAVARDAPVGS